MQGRNERTKFQQQASLDKEIDELWKLMLREHKENSCMRKVQTFNWVAVEYCGIKINGKLQNMIWNPGRLERTIRRQISIANGQYQL